MSTKRGRAWKDLRSEKLDLTLVEDKPLINTMLSQCMHRSYSLKSSSNSLSKIKYNFHFALDPFSDLEVQTP